MSILALKESMKDQIEDMMIEAIMIGIIRRKKRAFYQSFLIFKFRSKVEKLFF